MVGSTVNVVLNVEKRNSHSIKPTLSFLFPYHPYLHRKGRRQNSLAALYISVECCSISDVFPDFLPPPLPSFLPYDPLLIFGAVFPYNDLTT